MKIDLLHYSSPPVVGGVESVLGHHAYLMANAGHQVRIVAGRGEQCDSRIPFVQFPLADSLHPDVIALKAELDQGRVPERFNQMVDLLSVSLHKILQGTDVLIAHNVCSLNKNLLLTAALRQILHKSDIPRFILWHHDLAWTTPRYQGELYPGYPWDLLRTPWPQAEQVVVSDLRRIELTGLLGDSSGSITVVPNGVDALQFLSLHEQTLAFVHQLDLLAAEPLLLLPVRITPRKNIELALQVLAAMQNDFPNPILVVTGPLGPHNPANVKYMERLKALRHDLNLESSAHFLADFSSGYLPDSVIADFYRLADALFLPSREEGFGIPVLEAGLVGIPIFCTDIPPLYSLAGENAVYFNPDAQPGSVATSIHTYLTTNPSYRMRVKVRKLFTWEQIYLQYIAPLLESIG
jgi:glycosyltransferase involved in cell wall biosynthesis